MPESVYETDAETGLLVKATLAIAGVLLVLLPALALLQYRWLGDVGRAERAEMQASLQAKLEAIAEICDREITGLFMAVQSDPTAPERRFREWAVTSREPRIVKSLYVSATVPPHTDDILPIPILDSNPPRWAVAVLDRHFLQSQFLPQLLGRSFPYDIELQRTPPNRAADAQIELFRLRPQLTLPARGRRGGGVGLVTTAESVVRPGKGLYILTARHVAGSLDAAVARTRRRNLLISLAIEAVLATSVVLLVFSIRRVHSQAERQLAFVAGLSHDMRTPVAAIRNLAQNQSRGLLRDPAQVERYGTAILEQASRLTDSVERALGFAGMRAGKVSMSSAPYSVVEVLAKAITATTSQYPDAGDRIRVTCDADLPDLQGDAAAIDRSIQNLLANAIKYSPSGATIFVTARHAGENVEIAVADAGWGIPAGELMEIFKPFYRTRAARESAITGTGLGLTIVKAIIEEHSGTLACTSKPGSGSVFTITLPTGTDGSEGRRRSGLSGADRRG